MIIIFFFYIFLNFSECLEKRVNVTFTAWKGTDCNFSLFFPVCNTQNLQFFYSKTFSIGNLDAKCLNIPSDLPYSVDPKEIIWPHSYGFNIKDSISSSNEVIFESFCNRTSNSIQLIVYKLLNCQSKDKYQTISITLNKAIPIVHSPFGSQYNYTYSLDCEVYTLFSKFKNFNIYQIIFLLLLILTR
jgi:hypothetical protein